MIKQYLLIIGCIGLDQGMKWWTVENLVLHTSIPMIDNVFSLFYLQNDGAAWGMLRGQMTFFYVITAIVLAALFYFLHTEGKSHPLLATSFSLIIAGAIGNFIDRLRLGYVIDMFQLEFIDFPIFNIADVALTIGVVLMFIYVLFIEGRETKVKS